MTLPYLIDDCVFYILKFLQTDRSTLFNCLLVNRFWCKIIIPLLYANPFTRLNGEKGYLIINTFLSCLNEKEKSHLLKYKIPNLNLILNVDLKSAFEYPKYNKQLLTSELQNAIDQWSYRYLDHSFQPLIQVFYHMFLRQCTIIDHLEICPSVFKSEIFDVQSFNPSNLLKLSKLSTLTLSTYDLSESKREKVTEFLNVILKHCKRINQLNVKQLEVHNTNEISSIIKQQFELKEFSFTYSKNVFKNIFSSLESQKNSLVSLKFRYMNFHSSILQTIMGLHHLKVFEINSCHGMTLELCETFQYASFKLNELIILGNSWETNVTIQIIKYLGISLQQLRIIRITMEIMEMISQSCLNLDTLYISLEYNTSSSIFPYFKNLRIKNLNIMPQYLRFENGELITLDLDELARNFSKDVIKVSLFSCQFMKKENLSSFLNSCPDHIVTLNLRKKLDIEYLEIVLNHIEKRKNHNLKFLGCFGLDKILSDQELKMINQIKEKGIKLVEFNEIL